MEKQTILTTNETGIGRAFCDEQGQWQVEGVLAGQDVRCLAADPLDPQVVYAGTQGSGLFRSRDRGQSWEPAGLEGQVVKALAASPHQQGLL